MSAQKIRAALGQLQDDPDNETAWTDLADAATSPDPGLGPDELKSLLEAARRAHELRREWDAVARVLELETALHAGTPVEFAMQFELARVLDDECFDSDRAEAAYKRLLELRPGDSTATEALERTEGKREKWQELVERYVGEAEGTEDPAFKSSLLMSAAEVAYRFGKKKKGARKELVARLEKALEVDPKNVRAAALLERLFRANEDFAGAARVAAVLADESPNREERVAALVRLGRLAARKLDDEPGAASAYERVLDLWPGHGEAMAYLSELFSKHEQWEHLVALYEDQLRGGGVKPADEAGVVFQIAMVHWRMRQKPDAAEPYFDKLRRLQPSHPGMLGFFRELCAEKNDRFRLMTILTDAQRAMADGPDKSALATEIAKLAEAGANAQKAIDQYKTILRSDPGNRDARDALKRLYAQTEGWNALIELLRQDLERTPADDKDARVRTLREIAGVYREHIKSDTALVTVLTQIVQLDEGDIESLRELVRVYEALGRFRDLLNYQSKLAALLPAGDEKAELLRSVARRWLEQFSNVQNATEAFEALLAALPSDAEALAKLRELYLKRRAWPQLFALCEKELDAKSGAERLDLLGEMAKLAAERLDRGADASRLYKQILDEDPSRLDVLDLLEKQAERDKDFATVAETLERRVTLAPDDAARLTILQKLGAVCADRIGDPAAAARAWRRVLELQPGHNKALRVLRDAYLAAGDYDGLEELYASQSDWEGLAEVLSNAADRATDADVKVALSFRTARIFVEQIGAPDRAFRSYERVLTVRPDDAKAAEALAPIYESEEKWARLPALYEVLLAHADDARKLALYERLVDVTGNRLHDEAAALAWATKAYELAPGEATLDLLETASRAARSWDAYIQTVEAKLAKKKKVSATERRGLRAKLARLYATELGRMEEAIASYRALVEEDPDDAGAIETLDRILRAGGRRDDLRWLFELRAGRAEGDARAQVLAEWAALEEDVFGESGRAIALYRRVLEAAPTHAGGLRALPRLLLAAGEPAAAAEVLATSRDLADGEARAAREMDLAEIYLDSLARAADALDCAVRALELAERDARALTLLDRLLAVPETRARAAEVLESHYASSGDSRREAQALGVLLETTTDRSQRLALHTKLADVEEHKLSAAGPALDVVLRALSEFPQELGLWDRAAELATRAARPADLAEAYKAALHANPPLPEPVEVEICERAATLHDERLGDPEAATPYLERVLARQPGSERAFTRLKQILTSHERWADLEALYARAVEGTTDPSRRADLLNEVALVCEEIINEPEKAIEYYERILELEPLHDNATRALEQLYAQKNRWQKLAALLERRLETAAPDETVELKLRLGRLDLDQLGDRARALVHLEEVLRLDVANADARQLVERILDDQALRTRAAEVLEAVYDARGEVRDLVRVLEIRLEAASEPDAQRELLRRIAVLRDERLKDDQGALAVYARLVPLDPADAPARQRMTEIGRRLGAHEQLAEVLTAAADAADQAELRGEILMDVARLCEDFLADVTRAERVYKRVLAIDPKDANLSLPPARALERIYAAASKHAELADVLSTEVALEDDVTTRRDLLARLGELCESVLDDPARAIAAFRRRLDDEPADDAALAALERLYERTRAFRELVTVVKSREDLASDAELRKHLMVKRARTLAEELDDTEEAIAAFHAVLDDFGPERATLAALARLYEKTERWADLAETLEADLSLAEEPTARLDILARLGDLRRVHQADWTGSLDALRQALTIDPSHAPSRAALEKLLELEEARREAAETLHPLYEADGDHERLLKVLEIEAATADDPVGRLGVLETAARTAEGPLGDPGRAFGYAVRGVRDAAGEPQITAWIERAERLAAATGRFGELVTLLREVVPDILDGDVQLDVTLRIAELARTRLEDRELAREFYTKALELRGDERRALVPLESLYEEAGDATALLDVLKKRADAAASDEEKKGLLFRQARLLGDALHDQPGAIATYESILDLDLDPAAIDALEKLYPAADRWNDLVALYERQLDRPGAQKADLHVKIATVAHKHLGDVDRAFDEIAAALDADPQHAGAIADLEALLDGAPAPEQRARAAEILEPVYLKRADWKRVMAAIDARLLASHDPDERRALLKRLATLHEEQTEDYAAALETTAKLLHEDPSDEQAWGELERLAKVAGAEKRLAEIFAAELGAIATDDTSSAKLARRTGELYAELGELDRALVFHRRALAFEPESRPLFEAVDALLVKGNRPSERIELYRAALDHRYEPADRLAALHTIAELERTALGETDASIETYRAALDVDERDERALNALTALYREKQRFTDLADLYERRAENTASPDAAADLRLALARLYRDELANPTSAIDQYEQIVTSVPTHRDAIADLEALARDSDQKARVVEILRPLYEHADDWRHLIALNGQRFALAEGESERVAVLRETARLWEERGRDLDRALEALRQAFELDPDDGETRAELERVAEALSAWDDLADAFEQALPNADPLVRRELLGRLAHLHDSRRDDPRAALAAYERLAALDETDPEPLEAMDALATLLSDWQALVRVLAKKAELVNDDGERASLHRRIAEAKRDMLDDAGGAIAAYEQALELDPESAFTVDNLIELYEAKDDAKRLVELYRRRVELAGDDEGDLRYTLLVSAADRLEKSLSDRREAIQCLRDALDVRPGDHGVLRSLDRLLRVEQMWPELLENLKLEASLAREPAERVALRRDVGELYAKRLDDPAEAIEAYRLVLEEAPADKGAIAAVMEIGDAREDLRLVAADALEPVLRATSEWGELVRALELRLRAQGEAQERATTLRTIAATLDERLSKPADALSALLRAISETPDDASLLDEATRLAAASDGWSRYAEALEERAGAIFDAMVAKELWTRLGAVADERLHDDARAVGAYAKAVEQAGDDPEILARLDALYVRTKDSRALADVLERRIGLESTARTQADLLHRLAALQVQEFGDKAQGLATLQQALERDADHGPARDALEALTDDRDLFEEAAEALEAVYRARGDNDRLTSLYEKRISFAPSARERIRMRLDLAKLLEEKSSDAKRAQKVLEEALGDDPIEPDVLGEIERLAAINDGWQGAAKRLATAIDGAKELGAEATRDAWIRLAGWYEEKVRDPAGAESAFEKALAKDAENLEILRSIERLRRAPGRERDLVATLRRIAELEADPEAKRDVLREAKTIAETQVADTGLTEQVLRQLLADDDANVWALEELTKLRDAAGDAKEVLALLLRRAELAGDGREVAFLQHRAAEVARTRLGDAKQAIALFEALLDADPSDARAAAALRELYAETGRSKELAKLLARLVDVATSPGERTALRLELARLSDEKFDAASDAIETLRAVLDDEPGQADAVVFLSQLYEKTKRDEELAELLGSQIELAKSRGDSAAELAFSVRLGEVLESRLGNAAKAIETYQAVLDRDAAHAGALEALARLFEKAGEQAKAAGVLEKLVGLEQGEKAVATAVRLADVYGKLGDDEGIRRSLEKGLALDERNAEIRKRLATVYERTKNWGSLAELLAGDADAADGAPAKIALYRKAAELHLSKRGDAAAAATLLERASALTPDDRELLLLLCDAYSASGRGKDAAEALEKIVASFGGKRSKELAPIHQRLSRAYLAEGNRDRALAELDHAFKIDPGSIPILKDLGTLSLEAGDLERAQKTFRALLLQKLDPHGPITKGEVFFYLGDISHRQGDKVKAVQMLERALENESSLEKAKALLSELKK